MLDLRNILKEEYKKKEEVGVTPQSLIEMIERLMNVSSSDVVEEAKGSSKDESRPGTERRARMIRLPIQFPTEISVGQRPGDPDRDLFERWMSKIAPEGELQDKIGAIETFIKEDTPASVAETLSFLMFLNTFSFMIQEFNASVASFLWEPFLAALFGAQSVQVPTSEGDIADVKLLVKTGEGLRRVSLKILREEGAVGGSFKDLVDHFAEHPEQPMTYVVIKKFKDDTLMKFYEFDVSQESFFTYIGHPKNIYSIDKVAENIPYDGPSPTTVRAFIQDKIPEGYRDWKGVDVKIAGADDSVPRRGRPIQPGVSYDIYAKTIEQVAGKAGPGAKLSASGEHLWGDEEQYSDFYAKRNRPDFWETVKKEAPGYLRKQQFEIGWSYAEKIVKNIGNLDISKESLDGAFARGSASVGADLTELFNALADLVEDVSRFFLIDCGSPEGKQQKCTEADEKTRSQSGQEAVEETKVIQRVVNEKIAPRLTDPGQLQMFEEIT